MTSVVQGLESAVDALFATPAGQPLPSEAEGVVEALLAGLEAGEIRSAERDEDGTWHAVPWVKRGILVAFRAGRIAAAAAPGGTRPVEGEASAFVDKHNLPVRTFAPSEGVRIVPGGSSVRRGAYVAPGVVCMPPMYINVGSYVGPGTMVDSHALVGSCAQVGARVHLSAAAQIGGVLEPVNATPVVIEDDVVVGGNAGVYEGTIVRARAVLGAGVILTRGTPIFDLVHDTVHRASGGPLVVPEGAVVVGGARAVRSSWAQEHGLSLYTPVIVKYRDEKTDLATVLEEWLR
jgi:2,3,4,5-tetrahydropyridine-2-carboxylate N-succinyltransferase